MTEHIGYLLEKADGERQAVAHKLKLKLPTLKQALKEFYPDAKGETVYEIFHANPSYSKLQSPSHLYTRYIWEDIPYGLIGLIELAGHIGVKTPALSTVCQLAELMFEREKMLGRLEAKNSDETKDTEVRTLSSLGLLHLSLDDLLRYAETAELPADSDDKSTDSPDTKPPGSADFGHFIAYPFCK